MTKKFGKMTAIFIALIVVIRVGIGCHFLYEGLYKPSHGFSAKGFLGMAKGPTKDFYYFFLPDLDGSERLTLGEAQTYDAEKKAKQSAGLTLPVIEVEWLNWYQDVKKSYKLDEKQIAKTNVIVDQYVTSLREYAQEKKEDIEAFLGSKVRYQKSLSVKRNRAEHQKKRDWDTMMKLRKEGDSMASEPEKMGSNMQLAVWAELTASQKAKGMFLPIIYGENKFPGASIIMKIPVIKNFAEPSRLGILNLMVIVGLSAIGLCLILGCCTRLAALGGAVFLFNVCLSQFPWPTVYPYSPEVVGHFMIISKDTVEMLMLILLAIIPAGRWCGLDWYIWNFCGKYIFGWYGCKKDPLSPDELVFDKAA